MVYITFYNYMIRSTVTENCIFSQSEKYDDLTASGCRLQQKQQFFDEPHFRESSRAAHTLYSRTYARTYTRPITGSRGNYAVVPGDILRDDTVIGRRQTALRNYLRVSFIGGPAGLLEPPASQGMSRRREPAASAELAASCA